MERVNVQRQRGFSLVELLISMVLLSVIVLLSSFAYAQFSRYWDGRLGSFDNVFSVLRNGWLLEDILSHVHPYVVRNNAGIPRFYFEGNINGFVAVSKESLSRVDTTSVIRLTLAQNSDGSYDLLYEEAPMSQAALVQLTQRSNFSEPLTLLQSLEDAEFSYFGPEAPPNDSPDIDVRQRDLWTRDYNSAMTLRHPKKVRIQWSSDGEVISWLVDLVQPVEGKLAAMMPEGFDI